MKFILPRRFRDRNFLLASLACFLGIPISVGVFGDPLEPKLLFKESLTGPRVSLPANWVGRKKVAKSLPILVLAGHADSQGMKGSGTAGEAVDQLGADPMALNMSDELFWNLQLIDTLVRLGRKRGLNIRSYDPEIRKIVDENDSRTNWSVGARHFRSGGYAFEIHFDSYGEYGYGSGLIPAISLDHNTVDESLANAFGRYPILFRGGLGAPRRGIRVLEVAKLGGVLESKLRNSKTRELTLHKLALKIIRALENGLGNK